MIIKKIILASILASCWYPALSQQYLLKRKLSTPQKHLLKQIARYNKVESQYINRGANASEQYARFDSLRKISNTADIIAFTKYPSPVVRAYAFGELLDKKDIQNAFKVLQVNFQDTTAFKHKFGCIGSASTLGSYMYYNFKFRAKKNGFSISPVDQRILDEIYEKLPEYEVEKKIIARQIKED